MIYPNNKGVAIMGEHGFIGKALAKLDLPEGVYFFDSPSSGVLFDKDLDYCVSQTLNDLMHVLKYCRDHDKYLVYPSSATVYNKNTNYAHCKAAVEEIVACYPMVKSIGLRISAGYGPGEVHKGEYASVVYQWCKEMKAGKSPVIFGDGTQTRDFIYEDDIAAAIQALAQDKVTGVIDIGTGINTSFNQVVATINKVLGTDIKPTYVPKPKNYVPETVVQPVPFCKVSLEEGIRKIIATL